MNVVSKTPEEHITSNSAHGSIAESNHDREIPEVDLLTPLSIREITLKHRIAMSPMCQYSAVEGMPNDWHLVHLGSRAVGGSALVMVEATAVTRDGRISPGDLGIWSDAHVEVYSRIARFIASQGAVPAIQLAHAGRKASCDVPWNGGKRLLPERGGWNVIAPSALPFNETDPLPAALDEKGIAEVTAAFEEATRRALKAGFKIIELHSAHGYLLHEFLSPLSNQRTDQYGGTLENRMRLPLRVAEAMRKIIPQALPLFVRISATDWVEGGWDLEQSVDLAKKFRQLGVDLIDVSSGALVPFAKIPVGKGFQVPLARRVKEGAGIKTAAVGLVTEVQQANQIITEGDADLVFLGRELLREPYWALKAQSALGCDSDWPTPYGYAVKRKAR
jgi:2,4-dienoyl-CoA reductase-like NADH-dependent reductase (Old Yellow Enzyme family)